MLMNDGTHLVYLTPAQRSVFIEAEAPAADMFPLKVKIERVLVNGTPALRVEVRGADDYPELVGTTFFEPRTVAAAVRNVEIAGVAADLVRREPDLFPGEAFRQAARIVDNRRPETAGR